MPAPLGINDLRAELDDLGQRHTHFKLASNRGRRPFERNIETIRKALPEIEV